MKHRLPNFLALCFLIVVVVIVIGSCSQNSSEPLIVSREDMGDEWPFTVESGELRCDKSKFNSVTFHADGKIYALNGMAKTHVSNAKDIFEISRIDPIFIRTPENPVVRLNEPIRREIVKAMAECRAGRMSDVNSDQCPDFIDSEYQLHDDERERIISEGMILEWDPHLLPRISTGSMIADGLKLCDK